MNMITMDLAILHKLKSNTAWILGMNDDSNDGPSNKVATDGTNSNNAKSDSDEVQDGGGSNVSTGLFGSIGKVVQNVIKVVSSVEKESRFNAFLVEAGGGGGWGLIQWKPDKNIEIAAPKKGMSAGATSGNIDDYLLWELDTVWQRGLDSGGKSFWTNMNLETSVGMEVFFCAHITPSRS